jgi:hypothetical protein
VYLGTVTINDVDAPVSSPHEAGVSVPRVKPKLSRNTYQSLIFHIIDNKRCCSSSLFVLETNTEVTFYSTYAFGPAANVLRG